MNNEEAKKKVLEILEKGNFEQFMLIVSAEQGEVIGDVVSFCSKNFMLSSTVAVIIDQLKDMDNQTGVLTMNAIVYNLYKAIYGSVDTKLHGDVKKEFDCMYG